METFLCVPKDLEMAGLKGAAPVKRYHHYLPRHAFPRFPFAWGKKKKVEKEWNESKKAKWNGRNQ